MLVRQIMMDKIEINNQHGRLDDVGIDNEPSHLSCRLDRVVVQYFSIYYM